ncbi:MAG: ABC transporter ATP-binding protein [Myxococcota bacterium]
MTDVIKMVGYALVLFLLSPKLALWAFAIVPVLAFAAFVFRLKVREAFREVRVRIARINTTIQESVTGMKVVQLFGRETRNMAEFDAMNADHRDSWHKSIRYDSLLFATIEVATGVTMAVIIGVGTGLAEVGIMYVFIDYMQRFFMPLRDLSAKYSVMQSAMAGAERIFQVLDTQPRVRDAARQAPEGDPALRGCVEFEHVWFAYGDKVGRADDEIDWVLRDVSFRVEPGEKVAFVGATGAGKTTIIKLLTRLYDVDRGRVLVDGVDVRQIPQQDLRRRIATVLQDVFSSAAPSRATSPSAAPTSTRRRSAAPPARSRPIASSSACLAASRPTCSSAARTSRRASARSSASPARSRTGPTSSSSTRPPARSTPRPRLRSSAASRS